MYVNITIGKASGAQFAGFGNSLHETFQWKMSFSCNSFCSYNDTVTKVTLDTF